MPTPQRTRLWKSVTPAEIMIEKANKLPNREKAELLYNYTQFRPKLYKELQVPSYVHGYSLAIQYMEDWYLRNFPKDYYRYVYVNGKHVLDDWRNFNKYNVKHEKPMLAIIPSLNPDWDRDYVDMYMGSKEIMLRTSQAQNSFFKDYDFKQFIYLQMREMEMNFTFRSRLNSRSEQLDLYNKMQIWFRVGMTQKEYVSADFHIPRCIMSNIAQCAGFEVDEAGNIKDIYEFLQYCNAHSDLPIIFKMRAINQKPEFFCRVKDIVAHISIKDKLQLDDGERDGALDTNFHVEMQCTLHMAIPHFYAYMNEKPIKETIDVVDKEDQIGIYSIENFVFPPTDDHGWKSIAVTSYLTDPGDTEIDLKQLFNDENTPIMKILRYNERMGISSNSCINVLAYYSVPFHAAKQVRYHMNWHTFKLVLDEEICGQFNIDIGIYADMNYVNNTIINIEQLDKNRIKVDDRVNRTGLEGHKN